MNFSLQPIKAPSAVATTVTRNVIFHKGSYIHVGDVVQVEDINDGVYYAQIRGTKKNIFSFFTILKNYVCFRFNY